MRFKRPQVRYADTPQPATPYQSAAQVWDERIGSARVQAKNWRFMAFGCLALAVLMAGGLVWRSAQSIVTPYVIEVDNAGEVRAVGEAAYLLANGQGKSRAHVDGSARTLRSWRCVILSNGEMTIADMLGEDGHQVRAGQEARIVDLSAAAGAGMGAWQDLHGHETPGQFSDAIKAACAANYGTLGRAYIEALIQHRDELNLTKDVAAVV